MQAEGGLDSWSFCTQAQASVLAGAPSIPRREDSAFVPIEDWEDLGEGPLGAGGGVRSFLSHLNVRRVRTGSTW